MGENYIKIIELQRKLSNKIITHDCLNKNNIHRICGIDVSYDDLKAFSAAVIIDKKTLEIIEIVNEKTKVKDPYIPSIFMLREGKPILKILKLLKSPFDIVLVDGHGILHPRKCGLASFIGIMIDKPTIGVAKNLLCGTVLEDNYIEYNKTILGYRIKKNNYKDIYVSVGHRISLETAIDIIKNLIKKSEFVPEPLRIADINSKKYKSLFRE
ncbi:MAG: endonuclease V [Nitrososphaeraceae archaeon]